MPGDAAHRRQLRCAYARAGTPDTSRRARAILPWTPHSASNTVSPLSRDVEEALLSMETRDSGANLLAAVCLGRAAPVRRKAALRHTVSGNLLPAVISRHDLAIHVTRPWCGSPYSRPQRGTTRK